jgi:hypothetical protein
MSLSNYDEKAYKGFAPSYYLRDKLIFSVGSIRLPVLQTGVACGICPVIVMAGAKVHIATPDCAANAASNCYHMEGPVRVPDYASYAVMPDTGTLFQVKSAWLGHFLGTIGFAPIPMPPV